MEFIFHIQLEKDYLHPKEEQYELLTSICPDLFGDDPISNLLCARILTGARREDLSLYEFSVYTVERNPASPPLQYEIEILYWKNSVHKFPFPCRRSVAPNDIRLDCSGPNPRSSDWPNRPRCVQQEAQASQIGNTIQQSHGLLFPPAIFLC